MLTEREQFRYSLLEAVRSNSAPQLAELYTSDACSLRCEHCFHGDSRLSTLSDSSWKSICSDLYRWGTRRFALGGKEPFANDMSVAVAAYMVSSYSDVIVGAVCDGFSWRRYERDPRLAAFTYLEFSLDGNESVHDKIRGSGTFRKTVLGMQAARRVLPRTQLSVAMAVSQANIEEIGKVWEVANSAGINRLFIQPVEPSGFALPAQCIGSGEAKALVDAVLSLSTGQLSGMVLLFVPYFLDATLQSLLAAEASDFLVAFNAPGPRTPWSQRGQVRFGFMRERIRIPYGASAIVASNGQLLPHFTLKERLAAGMLATPFANELGIINGLRRARQELLDWFEKDSGLGEDSWNDVLQFYRSRRKSDLGAVRLNLL
jgi:hypothetical protein